MDDHRNMRLLNVFAMCRLVRVVSAGHRTFFFSRKTAITFVQGRELTLWPKIMYRGVQIFYPQAKA
ncbi:MAG: hypothetical protein CL398_04935 [Acidiferrobacteraceae bacterium]|nr:hypothetical protein [Acidiferrobacteraceae bacterium]